MLEHSTFQYALGLYDALERGLPDRYVMGHDRPLGRGGFGIVYEAFDTVAEESVAVKILEAPHQEDFKSEFQLEAQQLQSLQHPNIIGVKWTGFVDNIYSDIFGDERVDENVPYLIMEKAQGDVEQELQDLDAILPTKQAVSYLEQAMQGVAFAHGDSRLETPQIVHLDLKTANLLIVDGSIKVTDFGVAGIDRSFIDETGETRPAFRGTPHCMPPEQFEGDTRHTVDIYAAGVMGYLMLTEKYPIKPVNEKDYYSWYVAHNNDPIPRMSGYNRSPEDARLIYELQGPIERALAKEPTDRFPTMSAFREAILHTVAEVDAFNKRNPVHTFFKRHSEKDGS